MQICFGRAQCAYRWMADTENLPAQIICKTSNFAPSFLREITSPFITPKLKSLRQMRVVNLETIIEATVDVYQKGGSWAYDKEMTRISQELDSDSLNQLICSLVDREVRNHLPGLYQKILPFFSYDEIVSAIQSGGQVVRGLETQVHLEVSIPRGTLEKKHETVSFPNAVTNFFPSLFNTICVALTLFDEGNQPDMVWHCYLVLGIYFQILGLPLQAGLLLSGILGPLAAAAVVLGTSVIGISVIYGYLEWWRPFPKKLNFEVENLTIKARNGQLEECVGRTKEIEEIVKFFGGEQAVKRHILVIGHSGTGKTTLLKGAVKRLSEIKPERCVYDASKALSGKSNNMGNGSCERLMGLIKHLQKLSEGSAFILDELLSYVENPKARARIKDFLDKEPVTCWATATAKDYEAFLKDDAENSSDQKISLLQRFHVIDLRKSNPDITAMVDSYLQNQRWFIPCDFDAAKTAIDLSEEIQPEVYQPRNACDVLKNAIAEVGMTFWSDELKSAEQIDLESRLEKMTSEYRFQDRSCPCTEKDEDAVTKFLELENDLKLARERMHEIKQIIGCLKQELQEEQRKQRRIYEIAGSLMANMENESLKKEFLMMRFYEFSRRKSVLQEWEEMIPDEFPLRVTKEVISRELKKMKV